MNLNRTNHAQSRHQGRATIPLIESLVLDYGTCKRVNGVDFVYLDKKAKWRLSKAIGGDRSMRLLEPYLDQYLVVGDDGTIITTGYRTKRIRRQ